MANLFPDIYPTNWDPDYERFESRDTAQGRMLQINSYSPAIQFSGRARWDVLSRAQYDEIEDHWHTHGEDDFDLFNWRYRKLRGVFVAVADGISTVYTLPGKEITTPTIKHNDVAAGTQPTLLAGGGAQGEDQIQYTAGTKPAAGVVITIDAPNGRQRYTVNYVNARFPDRHREADVWIAEAEFLEVVVG